MSNHLQDSACMRVVAEDIDPVYNQYQSLFQKSQKLDDQQLFQIAISQHIHTNIQTLLKHIHHKFVDSGLVYTLIHKLFLCQDHEIAYYVPELVYIAIKKTCKPMRKLLISRSKNNESLRRLILWNIKAFTVLLKEKSQQIRKDITEFQEDIVRTVVSKHKFNFSLKAINMLTTASLILKKMPVESLKQKLQKFIKRFNRQYLNNLKHQIMIPFRQEQKAAEKQKQASHVKAYMNSNYVVHIIQEDCSCFPTRKRVPYRIIIQTIDYEELKDKHSTDAQKISARKAVAPDQTRDLFNQVTQAVQSNFADNIAKQVIYPFVIDTTQNKTFNEMKNFVSNIQKKENIQNQIQQKILTKSRNLFGKITKKFTTVKSEDQQIVKRNSNSLAKYKIADTEQGKKFDAIYIGGKTPKERRSDMKYQQLRAIQTTAFQEKQRKSDKYVQKQAKVQVQTYKQTFNLESSEGFWGKSWEVKKRIYHVQSEFSKFKSLRHRNVVVKGGDDLRQEIICMQLIYKMRDILKQAGHEIVIKPYEIIVLSQNSGLLEFVSNSISVDYMKKSMKERSQTISLVDFYNQVFNTQQSFSKAQNCFTRSLVGSAILTYVLKLKDRHNGNILLDMQGHIIQIDFGFILGMAPGKISFQQSPFKLTAEYVDLLGGKDSPSFKLFCQLLWKGLATLRLRVDQLCLILEIMKEDSDLDCFKDFQISDFKSLFKLNYSDQKFKEFCHDMVQKSYLNSWTGHYDTFQKYTNNIQP